MYLQLDTKFNPFTYDEMVKPLLYYKQAYDEAEAAYSDLIAQTEAWKDIANREKSPEAFEMYQRYSSELSRAADDFSRGMNTRNRRALLGLKRRYAQDIAPIARASEAMNAANELRAKAGPDAIFEVEEYNSLDPFLHGQTANNRYQSRNELIKETATITEAVMAEAIRDPEFRKAMGDQFWKITQHTGGSYKDLIEAIKLGIMDNPIAQNRFSQIRQSMLKKAGIERYGAAGQRAIANAIDLGMYAGLDKPSIQFQANRGYMAGGIGSGSTRSGSKGRSRSHSNEDDEYTGSESEIEYEDTLGIPDSIIVGNDGPDSSLWHSQDQEFKDGNIHGSLVSWGSVPDGVRAYIGDANPNYYMVTRWVDSDEYAEARGISPRTHYQITRKTSAPKEARGKMKDDITRGMPKGMK